MICKGEQNKKEEEEEESTNRSWTNEGLNLYNWKPSSCQRTLEWTPSSSSSFLVERNEIITVANLFSFASQSYWPISEGKKNLIKELCYRGEEKHGEKREEK